jgi:hypothetical protein
MRFISTSCVLAAVIFLAPVPHVLSSEFVREAVVEKPPPPLEGRGRASEVFDLLSIATDLISDFTAITEFLSSLGLGGTS